MTVRTGFGVMRLISAMIERAVLSRELLSKTVTSLSFTITTTFVAVHLSRSDGKEIDAFRERLFRDGCIGRRWWNECLRGAGKRRDQRKGSNTVQRHRTH